MPVLLAGVSGRTIFKPRTCSGDIWLYCFSNVTGPTIMYNNLSVYFGHFVEGGYAELAVSKQNDGNDGIYE
jgi:hypothetical protein